PYSSNGDSKGDARLPEEPERGYALLHDRQQLRLGLQQRHTTVDAQVDAIDEAAGIGSQEQCRICQFAWPAQPAQRNFLGNGLLECVSPFWWNAEFGQDLGVHRPGAEHVDTDAA